MSKKLLMGVGICIILYILGLIFFPSVVRSPTTLIPFLSPSSTPKESPLTRIGGDLASELTATDGFAIHIFTRGLSGPRDLAISPGGALLVSEPGAGKIQAFALPKREKKTILTGLVRPHGIAFYQQYLVVAEEERVVRYRFDETTLSATQDKVLFPLPKGGRHRSRSITFDPQGKMYVSVGSTCDVCVEKDERLSAVLVSDIDGTTPRVYARGLRNSVFLTTEPTTGSIWATEMGRDFLGDALPPDEINRIEEGKDYGWPNCYGKQIFDPKGISKDSSICQKTQASLYDLPAHVAPLGLTFINSVQFPQHDQGDLLVAYHGSWNSTTPVGYKVVRLDVEDSRVVGATDFITGFIASTGVRARPVDLVFDASGNLFISDDHSDTIYVVSKE